MAEVNLKLNTSHVWPIPIFAMAAMVSSSLPLTQPFIKLPLLFRLKFLSIPGPLLNFQMALLPLWSPNSAKSIPTLFGHEKNTWPPAKPLNNNSWQPSTKCTTARAGSEIARRWQFTHHESQPWTGLTFLTYILSQIGALNTLFVHGMTKHIHFVNVTG